MKNKRLTKRTDTDFIELVEEANGLEHKVAVKHAIQRLAEFEDKLEQALEDLNACYNCKFAKPWLPNSSAVSCDKIKFKGVKKNCKYFVYKHLDESEAE